MKKYQKLAEVFSRNLQDIILIAFSFFHEIPTIRGGGTSPPSQDAINR